jgi:hypothetical protein
MACVNQKTGWVSEFHYSGRAKLDWDFEKLVEENHNG